MNDDELKRFWGTLNKEQRHLFAFALTSISIAVKDDLLATARDIVDGVKDFFRGIREFWKIALAKSVDRSVI